MSTSPTTQRRSPWAATPSKMLTALKNSCLDEDGNLWLKQADSTALGYSTMNLDAAFDNFFRGRKKGQNIGYPRFKRRFDSAQSYKTQGGQLLGTYPDGSPAKLILKGMGKTPVPSPLPEEHPLRTVRWQYVYLPKVGKVRVKVRPGHPRKAGAVLRHQGEEVPHEEACQAVMKAKSDEEREAGWKCR